MLWTGCREDDDRAEYYEKKMARENGMEYDQFGEDNRREYDSEDELDEEEAKLMSYYDDLGRVDDESSGLERSAISDELRKLEQKRKRREEARAKAEAYNARGNDDDDDDHEGGGSGGEGYESDYRYEATKQNLISGAKAAGRQNRYYVKMFVNVFLVVHFSSQPTDLYTFSQKQQIGQQRCKGWKAAANVCAWQDQVLCVQTAGG